MPAVFRFVLPVRSRRREYAADARAAEVTCDPEALASALEAIHAVMTHRRRLKGLLPVDGSSPASDPLYRIPSTRPAMESRVERLRARAHVR